MSGSSGIVKPIAEATSPEADKPAAQAQPGRNGGRGLGDSARYSAAESSTASSAVTHEDIGRGERNRTSGM